MFDKIIMVMKVEKDIFCKINEGEIPSNLVYEDELLKVIMDKFPNSPGHMLIIPKSHVKDALDINDETFSDLNHIIKEMIKKCYDVLGASGVTVIQNNGTCQEIKHYHVHIIPRYDTEVKLSNEEIYKKLIEK